MLDTDHRPLMGLPKLSKAEENELALVSYWKAVNANKGQV